METKKGRIVSHLRALWLRSAERAAALKREGYCCEICKVKHSRAKGKEQKMDVHHKEGILNWQEIIDVIRKQLLCTPDKLKVMCPDCHAVENATK